MNFQEYVEQKESITNEISETKEKIKKLKQEKQQLKKSWKTSKNEKAIHKAEKRKLRRAKEIEINQPPHLTLLEEIGNAVTHGLGTIFAITAIVLMIVFSTTIPEIIGASIYGFCMLMLFTMSCLYHSFKYGSTVKRIFRRFDYSSIYLLIGGTFAPILLLFAKQPLGLIILIIQWVIIITGITLVAIFGPGRLKWLHFPMYFILGWLAGIFIIPQMIRENITFFWWILTGGLIYTIGMIPFCMGEKRTAHFIWHFFVLFGAVIQWIGIFIYLYK